MYRSLSPTLAALLAFLTLTGCADNPGPAGPTANGRASTALVPPDQPVPKPPLPPHPSRPGAGNFVQIVAGFNHTCVLRQDQTVYCWGLDDQGQAGTWSTKLCASGLPCVDRPTILEVRTPGGGSRMLTATTIAAGRDHNCIIDQNHDAYCWGRGDEGQVAFDPSAFGPVFEAMPVVGGLKFSLIAAGGNSSCAMGETGVYCWGQFQHHAAVPTTVSSYAGASALVIGDDHACYLDRATQAPGCWGFNFYGQLARMPISGTLEGFSVPTLFPAPVTALTTGLHYTCAELSNGSVQCAGENSWGQLGNGARYSTTGQPQTVGMALHGVSTGASHACGLDATGAAFCWGNGYAGQLGHGTSGVFDAPQAVVGGRTYRAIAAGGEHTCAIGTDNHIYCWGRNNHGQLGTQYPGSWMTSPVQALDPVP